MARQTHYEVHVFQNGRWSIHAQFDARQQEMAIEEGKTLDQMPSVQAVKVVREVYDSSEGTHRDFVVYKSADAPPSDDGPEAKATSTASSWQNDDDDEDDDYGQVYSDNPPPKRKKEMNKKTASLTSIIVKLLLVTLFSICLAAIFTVMTSSILSGVTLFGTRIVGNAESNLLFVTFVFVFLASAALLTFTFLRGTSLAERQQKSHAQQVQRAQAQQKKQQAAAERAERKQGRQDEAARKKRIEKKRKAKDSEAREEIGQAMEGIEDFKTPDKDEDDEVGKRLQDALEATTQPDPEESLEPATDAATGAEALSPHAEKQKVYMMKFLDDALEGAGTDHKKLDNFNKFGVNLFLAGACETLGQTRDLDEGSQAKVLADSVRVMGFKKSHAATFAGKYEEYLMQDPRYMQMFQAGRNSMNTYYQDEAASAGHLEKALNEWNKPKPKEEQSGPITVLFTDIAGSTAMTQALGDAGAQKVVRAHNRVVRDALTDHAGKEIKHTGDGIMASFAKTTDSVAAAIQMQRETMAHNQQNPDLPLHLKIGLNAGEPISEDNDLFGSTVQMSARIVDKAQADEIFVSEIIRGICEGKGYKFVNRGGYEMKGFSEPPTLFEVVWREDGQAAAE